MRWSNLSAPHDGDSLPDRAAPAAPPLPLALPGATVRTFDTPGFAGMTFYEIQAKSLINRVPGESRVPFEWTINPYRGCSHACAYCLAGDTPILMADGSTRPLAELRRGDAIMGTMGAGACRRYVPTTVLDHWSTVEARLPGHPGRRHPAGRQRRPPVPHRPRLAARQPRRAAPARARRRRPDVRRRPLRRAAQGVPRLSGRLSLRPDPRRRRPWRGGTAREGDAWIRADGYLDDIPLHEALRWPELPTGGWFRGFLAGAFGATGRADRLAVTFTSGDQRLPQPGHRRAHPPRPAQPPRRSARRPGAAGTGRDRPRPVGGPALPAPHRRRRRAAGRLRRRRAQQPRSSPSPTSRTSG